MSVTDLASYELLRAPSLAALVGLVAARHSAGCGTVLLAGGTDWLVEQEARAPLAPGGSRPVVIDVSRMPELRALELVVAPGSSPEGPPRGRPMQGEVPRGERLRIGAAVTYLELRRSALVRERAPLLARMAADVGALQIQARGTLGGNLATASPAADGVAALAAFDAVVLVESVRGRRTIPFASLQTGYKTSTRAPDEVIVAVELALPSRGAPWFWRKVAARRAQAISKVSVAGIAEVVGGRATRFGLGMASVAPVTARLAQTRELALSAPLGELGAVGIERVVESDVAPIDDVRSTGAYRLHCAKALVKAWFRQLGARC